MNKQIENLINNPDPIPGLEFIRDAFPQNNAMEALIRGSGSTTAEQEGSMKTIEYTTIDREALGWPSGPWDTEPDKKQWQDEKTELPCIAVRHDRTGHWCGYVGLDESHPLYKKGYDDPAVNVHGGLTYADMCQPDMNESEGICHVPEPGEPDHVWWLGFDCAHLGDGSPVDPCVPVVCIFTNDIPSQEGEYRTLDFVIAECASLAKQLHEHRKAA